MSSRPVSHDGAVDKAGDVGVLRDVAVDVVGSMARSAQIGREGLAGPVGDVAQEDMCAFARHRFGDRVPNAVGSAGDDRDFPRKSSHVSLQSRAGASFRRTRRRR